MQALENRATQDLLITLALRLGPGCPPEGADSGFEECEAIVDLSGTTMNACRTQTTYAHCVARLLEGELEWCRYTGSVERFSVGVPPDLYDVHRASVGQEVVIREQCPAVGVSSGVGGSLETPDILLSSDDQLVRCPD